MFFYEKLEDLIGAEVELFENRNTGKLEIRPAEFEGKKAPTDSFISDVGQDYVTIEIRGVGKPYFDAYPFTQVTLRGWDDRLLAGKSKKPQAASGGISDTKTPSPPNSPSISDWL